MKALIFQAVVVLGLIGFLAFLAYDDRRNTREREEEDRLRAEKNSTKEPD